MLDASLFYQALRGEGKVPVTKKVPSRICVGCQSSVPKRELLRVVRTVAGSVEVDPTGKKSGRGVYVCPRFECIDRAFKAKRLEKALQQPVGEEVLTVLRQQAEARQNPGPRVVRIP